ncbi:hypothetical protein [Paeniglutamicibacter sp.]
MFELCTCFDTECHVNGRINDKGVWPC